MRQKGKSLVQSCLTSVSFPDTLDGVLGMVEKQSDDKWITDTDVLLNLDVLSPEGTFWTAPKWITTNDILFFYNTKRAKTRTSKLLKQAKGISGLDGDLIRLLERSAKFTLEYSGSIFACSPVSGISEYFTKDPGSHFDSRCFAPIEKVHFFENPLSSQQFSNILKIGQNTLTPIYRQQFEAIKELLAKQNRLPEFLEQAEFGDLTFHNVDNDNWYEISCQPDIRFINELQFREYLLNYFLDDIKDKKTPVLKECQCYRRKSPTGFADYFVSINGKWIPVEAKMNIVAEKDLFAQLSRYVEIDSFKPTVGNKRGAFFETAQVASFCLVADQSGIYMTQKGKFVDSDYGYPNWRREDLNKVSVQEIREKIIEISTS